MPRKLSHSVFLYESLLRCFVRVLFTVKIMFPCLFIGQVRSVAILIWLTFFGRFGDASKVGARGEMDPSTSSLYKILNTSAAELGYLAVEVVSEVATASALTILLANRDHGPPPNTANGPNRVQIGPANGQPPK